MPVSLGFGLHLTKRFTGAGVSIAFDPAVLSDTAVVGTAVGTATVAGATTGVPTWSLANSAGGKYAINSATGAVTVAAALTDGVDTIIISVSGLTPNPNNSSFPITVSAPASAQLLADTGTPILADTGTPILVQ